MPHTNDHIVVAEAPGGHDMYFAFIVCFACGRRTWVKVSTNKIDRILCDACNEKVPKHDG